jgi:hypothetical protein
LLRRKEGKNERKKETNKQIKQRKAGREERKQLRKR